MRSVPAETSSVGPHVGRNCLLLFVVWYSVESETEYIHFALKMDTVNSSETTALQPVCTDMIFRSSRLTGPCVSVSLSRFLQQWWQRPIVGTSCTLLGSKVSHDCNPSFGNSGIQWFPMLGHIVANHYLEITAREWPKTQKLYWSQCKNELRINNNLGLLSCNNGQCYLAWVNTIGISVFS